MITSNETAPRIELTRDALISANGEGQEIFRLEYNGDFYYRGKLIGNDMEVIEAFRDFLSTQGYPKTCNC